MYQLTRITRDRGALANDDRLDALAIAVAYFTAQMALEHAKEEQKDKERRLQEELQRFMEVALGASARRAGGAIKRYS